MESPASANPVKARKIGLALSGGGVRALLYGLGALRAVVAAREQQQHKLVVLIGVSGGALGAAFAASRLQVGRATLSEFDAQVLRPAFETITHHSMMFGRWYIWAVIAIALVSIAVGIAAAAGAFHLGLAPRIAVPLVALAVLLIAINVRGPAIERSMRDVLFGADQPLSSVHGETQLVLQTSDLDSGEATYLTSLGLSSYRWGEADAGALSLVHAARASANFPIVFGALRLDARGFPKKGTPRTISLVDGGVYDNMGSEWLLNPKRTDDDVYRIVVNASRNLQVKHGDMFGVPLLGEVLVLLRERDIQYDATTAPRRRWLRQLFVSKEHFGCLVAIDKKLADWVDTFAGKSDPRGERAGAMKLGMQPHLADYERWPDANPAVKTSLGKVRVRTAADLVRAGYLATAIETHILEGWPAPESLDPAEVIPWLDNPNASGGT